MNLFIINPLTFFTGAAKARQQPYELTNSTPPKDGRVLWLSNTAYPGYDAYQKKNGSSLKY